MLSKIRPYLKRINSSKLFSSASGAKLLVEMVSIFLAVSLAFALNKWNENRNNKNLETKILKEIYSGLIADSTDMSGNKAGHEAGMNILKKIVPILKKDTILGVSIYSDYNILFRTFLSIQNNSGYESLKSVGLDKISNDTLLNQIVQLYENQYQMIEKMEEQYKENQINDMYFATINDLLMPYATYARDSLFFDNMSSMDKISLTKLKVYISKLVIARQFSIMTYGDCVENIIVVKKNVAEELERRGVDIENIKSFQ